MILTKIYINNEQIDLKEDVSIPLNFNISDIREPEKRSTTWSKTVILPGTSFNNKLFSNIWNVNSTINSTGTNNYSPNFNPNLKAVAEITYNEAIQFKGICQLLNVNVTDKYEIEYEVAFFGELQNVYQFFNNRYLRDIDLSQYNHAYTLYNQQLSWNNTEGYVYPMIDYGYGINTQFRVENMFPAIYVKTIIDKMFSEAGFSYQSNFFNSTLFKKLIIPYSGGSALKLTNEQVINRTIRASKTSNQSILNNYGFISGIKQNTSERIIFQDDTTSPNFDGGNNWYDQDGGSNLQTYKIPKNGNYTINVFIKANLTHQPSTSTAELSSTRKDVGVFGIVKNPTSNTSFNTVIAARRCFMKRISTDTDADDAFMFTAGSSLTISSGSTSLTSEGTLSISCYLNKDDIIQFKYNTQTFYNEQQAGSVILDTVYKSGSTYQEFGVNSNFKMNVLSDSYINVNLADTNVQEGDDIELSYVLPDKIKQSDFFNSIIKAFNLFVEVDKGNPNKLYIEPRHTFYSSGTINDWSYKLDYSKETKIIPLGELNNKTYLFKYKEDTDFFNNDYQTTYTEIYGQKKYDILNDFLKGEVLTELIFSPTPLVDTVGHDRIISKIYTLDSNGTIKPSPSNIRLLYWGGLKTTSYAWQHTASSGTTQRVDFPYAGHLDDVNNPTIDLNFGVPNQVYYTPTKYTANNLYNKYWRDYVEQISDKDSKIFSGYFLLNEFDIQSLDFRDTFFFENEYWRLNKIIDYDRINNQPTKCEFIKLKTLPEYVEDNGVTINGGTILLDNLTPAPTARIGAKYNNNFITEGAIVSGKNNIVSSGNGIIVTGNDNVISYGSSNVSVLSSTGVTVLGGVSNVSVTNSSGITITESNVTYNNGIKTYNNVSYKKYIALLSQTGTNAPTAIVLENTLSTSITWSYVGIGQYQAKITNEFPEQKTWVIGGSADINAGSGDFATLDIKRIDNDTIELRTYDNFNVSNSLLVNTAIEIRVYS